MVPKLTRRRALAVLASIGSGSVLGRCAVSAARGAAVDDTVSGGDRSIPVYWEQQPTIGVGDHGPVFDVADLASSPRRLIVNVDVDEEPAALSLSGRLDPQSASADAVSVSVWATTPGATEPAGPLHVPSDRVHASGPATDVFGVGSGTACEDGLVLDPGAHPGRRDGTACYPGSRTYSYALELTHSAADAAEPSNETTGPSLELSFDATSCPGDARDDGCPSAERTVRRNRSDAQPIERGAVRSPRSSGSQK